MCQLSCFYHKLSNRGSILHRAPGLIVIVLVSHHNKLWVLYLDCTRGYLQFDMLVAVVSVRNN